jgi:histidyl-tRNA synthetase
MSNQLRAVRGMNDILPADTPLWQHFEGILRAWLKSYGYRELRTPSLEHTGLFKRAIGEVTDIVEKEMYTFVDELNGESMTLRPEGTASGVRAVIEHNLLFDGGKRLWYAGPMFRHERPQKGRYRQFHQFGAEAMGFAGPDVDAELILMCRALWRELGLVEGRDVRLELNSLGQADERRAHRDALVAHLVAHADRLDEDARRRLETNPLRILDTKNPAMQPVVEAAPKLIDFLGEASLAHLGAVREVLDAAGLAYRINPRLVRGMDYYNLTVFEWVTDRLGSQGTVCGGGRYDSLIEQLGGRPAPAVGFGMGLERLLLLLAEAGLAPPAEPPVAYAIVPEPALLAPAMLAIEALRAAGVSVLMHAGGHGMKAQFKRADASGARYALVFGRDELARGELAVKPLRDPGAAQRALRLDDIAAWAGSLLNA